MLLPACRHVPEAGKRHGLEVHLFAPEVSNAHVELLSAIGDYHLSGVPLGLGHSVNFGRSWLPGSRCSYGLLSLPYLDGPDVEWLRSLRGDVRCLWLIPITGAERNFLTESGLEALEDAFERAGIDYLNPLRASVK